MCSLMKEIFALVNHLHYVGSDWGWHKGWSLQREDFWEALSPFPSPIHITLVGIHLMRDHPFWETTVWEYFRLFFKWRTAEYSSFFMSSFNQLCYNFKLLKYQNKRGGRVVLQDIQKPLKDEWGSPLDVMQAALELEKNVNQSLLDLHSLAERHGDKQMCDFIEGSSCWFVLNDLYQLKLFVLHLWLRWE